MTLPLVLIGLILMIAGASWFPGAATVGLICLIVGMIGVVLPIITMIVAAVAVTSGQKRWRR